MHGQLSDLSYGLNFDRHARRERVCARRNSRMLSSLSQNLTNEVRSCIENAGLLLKAVGAPHKTGDTDYSNDPIQIAIACVTKLSQHVQCAKTSCRLTVFD